MRLRLWRGESGVEGESEGEGEGRGEGEGGDEGEGEREGGDEGENKGGAEDWFAAKQAPGFGRTCGTRARHLASRG